MATGYSRSIEHGSELIYDYSCNPCSKDDKIAEAGNYCKECCQFLCSTCRTYHDKFLVNHQMLDKAGMKSRGLKQQSSFPTERCKRHPSEMINLFCPAHDTACCSACVALDHRPCTDVTYLSKAAEGIRKSKEYNNIKDAMTHVRDNLDKLRRARQGDKVRIGKEKTKVQMAIKAFRKKLNTLLDDMEKVTLSELDRNQQDNLNNIDADITQLEDMIATMDKNVKQIETFQGTNESELFLYVKKGKHSSLEGCQILNQATKRVGKESIQFLANQTLEQVLLGFTSLGDFCKVSQSHASVPFSHKGSQLCTAKLHTDINVKLNTDSHICKITATVQLPDRSMLIIDHANKMLKRLDTSYAIADSLDMPGSPWGVCVTGPQEEVAVSLYGSKIIQFVSTGAKLSATKSFNVGVNCRGVAFYSNELFVSCEDSRFLFEGTGHIRVYDMTGQLKRTFHNDPAGKSIMSSPKHIAVSSDGSRIYIADRDSGILTLEKQGKVIVTLSDPRFKYPYGVCLDNKDNLFMCGYTSHHVLHLSHDGSDPKVLLNENDDIKNPRSVCYDSINHRLVVSMDASNIIKVFELA